MAKYFNHEEVQDWINSIEDTLEGDEEFRLTPEEEQIYGRLERHYKAAQEIVEEDGLTDEACLELEAANEALDDLGYEIQLQTEPRGSQSWQEFYEDNL